MTYSKENKYQSRHLFKKESSKHKRRQQECPIPKGKTMVKKNNSQTYYDKKEVDSRRMQCNQRNSKK